MEVRKFFAALLTATAPLITLSLAACGPTKTEEAVFPKVGAHCAQKALQGRHIARWTDGHISLVPASAGNSRSELIANFVRPNLAQLDRIEPDYPVHLNDSSLCDFAGSLAKADNWGAVRINADQAWQQNARGQNVVVAIVDSGVDTTHPQLTGRALKNPAENGTDPLGQDRATNGIDDDNNGYIDDSAGFNFTNDTPTPNDPVCHGTHVGGIIAAHHTDNQAGEANHVQGIAPEAKILPLAFIDASGNGTIFNAMRAIDYAQARGAKIINASWGGGDCSTLLRDQIEKLAEQNVIFVAAAGNSGNNLEYAPEFPAAFTLSSQLTVGASGLFDYRANFSNYSSTLVHTFAPGVDIISTLPGNKMASESGTSMATPFVSGALAALLSFRPQATPSQLRLALLGSVKQNVNYENASRGRIDLGAAITELSRILP
jgi:subtilisin family serine protease